MKSSPSVPLISRRPTVAPVLFACLVGAAAPLAGGPLTPGPLAAAFADARRAPDSFAAPRVAHAALASAPQRLSAKQVAALRARAEAGDAGAQYQLGSALFLGGRGLARDEAEGMRWVRLAAGQGHAEAEFMVGAAHSSGRGAQQDWAEAARWYGKAAEQGHADAQFFLADCYSTGRGLPQDIAVSVAWLAKAAEQGHAAAQSALGGAYLVGRGVPQDGATAVVWIRRAAEQGFAEAQMALAVASFTGSLFPTDPVEGLKWATLAAEGATGPVKQDYARQARLLAATMSKSEVKEAAKRVNAWRKANKSIRD